jgi:hypothetical protein
LGECFPFGGRVAGVPHFEGDPFDRRQTVVNEATVISGQVGNRSFDQQVIESVFGDNVIVG